MSNPTELADRRHLTRRDLPVAPPVVDAPPPLQPPGAPPRPPVPPPGFATEGPPPAPPRRTRRGLVLGAVAALLVVALGGALLVLTDPFAGDDAAEAGAGSAAGTSQEPAARAAAALLPSVVQIETDGGAMGAGFVYEDGYVLTVAHVVGGSDTVAVRLSDGTEIDGEVVGANRAEDVAVVAVDPATPGLVVAELGRDTDVEVGEVAVAIGSPLGVDQSVTSGIISGLDRTLEMPDLTLTGLLQTDAPINPGNSGGPLADGDGRVIGLNTAIATQSGGSDGLGFAIPIGHAVQIATDLRNGIGNDPADDPGGLGGLDELLPDLPDLGDLDQILPGLGELFDWLLGDGGLFDQPAPSDPSDPSDPSVAPDGLLGTDGLPSAYEVVSSQVRESGDTLEQVVELDGPDGTVTIQAEQGPDVEAAFDDLAGSGDPIEVRTTEGIVIDGSSDVALAWLEDGGSPVLVVITAPAGSPTDDLVALAEALEVRS